MVNIDSKSIIGADVICELIDKYINYIFSECLESFQLEADNIYHYHTITIYN